MSWIHATELHNIIFCLQSSFLVKAVENIIHLQLQRTLEEIDYLNPFQTGFRDIVLRHYRLCFLRTFDSLRKCWEWTKSFLDFLDLSGFWVDQGILLDNLRWFGVGSRCCVLLLTELVCSLGVLKLYTISIEAILQSERPVCDHSCLSSKCNWGGCIRWRAKLSAGFIFSNSFCLFHML